MRALALELTTTAGRINFVFGVIAAGMVATYLAGKTLERIGNFILRLVGRQGTQKGARDNFYAVLSLLVYFLVSLVVIIAAEHS